MVAAVCCIHDVQDKILYLIFSTGANKNISIYPCAAYIYIYIYIGLSMKLTTVAKLNTGVSQGVF